MVITRTPFRISFFGGGTDFPAWYKDNRGAVLSTTIDKYCYISCRELPPFFDFKHRIVYSKQEYVKVIDEIRHPAVREVFRFVGADKGLVIHHDGDLPANTGLGSSSAFTVGLLHALSVFNGKPISKKQLALDSIHIEQDMIKENVGSQDQVAVTFGGLNRITFSGNRDIDVTPIDIPAERMKELQSHLMVFFTGFTRIASEIEGEKINNISKKTDQFKAMYKMVDEAIAILKGGGDLGKFGKLLHESWSIKKSLSEKVSSGDIDGIYDIAIRKGAVGGKILGAGGGGFMLFFVRPDEKEKVREGLKKLVEVPFRFDTIGSKVIYNMEASV